MATSAPKINVQKILITGGTGFIGHHLTNKLINNNYKCHLLIRKNSKLDIKKHKNLSYSIFDGEYNSIIKGFKEFNPQIVIHLAALTVKYHQGEDIREVIDSNICYGAYVLEAMKESNCFNILNTCSYWQYSENGSNNPINLYAASKNAFEEIVKYYVLREGINCINLILFENYGPSDKRKKIFNVLKNYENNDLIDMTAGEQKLNMLHIFDIVNAYLISLKLFPKGPISLMDKYSIKSNTEYSLKEIVEKYLRIKKKRVSINWGGRPYMKGQRMNSKDNGKKLPGWREFYSLEKGIMTLEN